MAGVLDADGPVPVALLLSRQPAERVEPETLARIRDLIARHRQLIVALDDDPTGTQSVHGVPVITRWQRDDLRWAMSQPEPLLFALTNSRSLGVAEAVKINEEIADRALDVASDLDFVPVFVSRGDSTLRGHFPAETDALQRVLARRGRPIDGVLLCPCFHEAGRVTVEDVHWVVDGMEFRPASTTEYAADAAFGYRNSNLRAWVEERTAGAVPAAEVRSLSLADIRSGGSERVAEVLADCRGGVVVVVNALSGADLDVVALGALTAGARGTRLLYRTGPSLVRALGGMAPRPPLDSSQIYGGRRRDGHGLVVVGSHTDLTTRQLDAAVIRGGLKHVELDVPLVLDPLHREAEVDRVLAALRAALPEGDVALSTSRELATRPEDRGALAVARSVSAALVSIVSGLGASAPLKYLVVKGGITASDVVTGALGIRRACVAGQLIHGGIPLWVAPPGSRYPGLPVAIFPGNVGDGETLADVLTVLRAYV